MNLTESLQRTPEDQLRRIAQTLGIALEGAPTNRVAQIAARLSDPTALAASLSALSAEEWAALRVVYFNGGDQGITVELCHQIVNLIAGRRRSASQRTLEALQSKGLLFLRPQNYRQVFFIPSDLLPVVGQVLHQQMVARLALDAEPTSSLVVERALPEELHRFLAYIHTHEVTLTQQGQLFRRHLRALLDLLVGEAVEEESAVGRYPEPLGLLVGYALDRHLVARENGRFQTTADLTPWIDQPAGAKRLDLFRYWQDRYFYQDLQTFLGVIKAVGPVWISVNRLAEDLEPLINPSQRGSLLVRLRHHLVTFLGPLGLFDVAEGIEADGAQMLACRLTGAGEAILAGREPSAIVEPGGPRMVVQATFEAIAPRPVPDPVLWNLELMADLIDRTDRTLTYRISRTSVHRALKAGLQGDGMLLFLQEQSATGIPQNVAFDLKAWTEAYGQVYLQEVMLLRCANSLLAQQVKNSRRTKEYVIAELTPTDLIVDGSRSGELLEALEADGLMPRPEVDRPRAKESRQDE